ncbi:hypothetical protein GOODEAATRI_020507 [Goodea atripinnis]|uniref:Uncharacterized protein n=1 Tax=Goodea atripinnis TaxID=208336 RepID=A0ABV0P6H4_9TELE
MVGEGNREMPGVIFIGVGSYWFGLVSEGDLCPLPFCFYTFTFLQPTCSIFLFPCLTTALLFHLFPHLSVSSGLLPASCPISLKFPSLFSSCPLSFSPPLALF